MKSRELVIRTLEFDNPVSIPRQLWLLPWALDNHPDAMKKIKAEYPDDIIHAPGFYAEMPKTKGEAYDIGFYTDEWGCVFENKQKGVIGEVKSPLVQQWSDLEKVKTPDECLSINIEKVNSFCSSTDKFVLSGCCPRPFERIQFLRGTENVMMDIALQEQGFKDLLNIIHQYYLKELEVWAKTDVDGLMFMDDWGSQLSLLISPDSWRQFFKPLYKEYIDIAHSNGKKIFMHSDGYIVDIIDDLIELGLDAVNSQIFCMGIDKLSERFKGNITFWGEIDRQHLLPNGSEQDIMDAVNEIYSKLYSNGGVIAQLEFGPGAKPENVLAAFDQWNSIKL